MGIDYAYERTKISFSDVYAYSNNADMSDKVQCEYGESIPVESGKDVYIQRQSTDTDFVGEIFHLEVPERPNAPEVKVLEITETSATLQEIDGAMYSYNDGEWQESPKFTDLTPGTKYLFKVYLPATESSFCSESGTANITTNMPDIDPSEYSFEVKYVDGDGNPVLNDETITFDRVGLYSREDIPIPYEYIEIIPAHTDDDWMYPTALEFIDGQWMVTNSVVEIMVETKATVNIIFKISNGKVLQDLGFTKYYDSEGGIEIVDSPEGYELVDGNTYAVKITRGTDGKLVADPTEVVFVVKAVGRGEPSEPSISTESTDSSNTNNPDVTEPTTESSTGNATSAELTTEQQSNSNDSSSIGNNTNNSGTSLQTGETSNAILFMVMLFALAVVLISNRKLLSKDNIDK